MTVPTKVLCMNGCLLQSRIRRLGACFGGDKSIQMDIAVERQGFVHIINSSGTVFMSRRYSRLGVQGPVTGLFR